jgi:hypothetical protein
MHSFNVDPWLQSFNAVVQGVMAQIAPLKLPSFH